MAVGQSVSNYNGTLRWHPAMAPCPLHPGTLVPRPIRHSGSSPSPLLEVRTPIAIAIWGKIRGYRHHKIGKKKKTPKIVAKNAVISCNFQCFCICCLQPWNFETLNLLIFTMVLCIQFAKTLQKHNMFCSGAAKHCKYLHFGLQRA